MSKIMIAGSEAKNVAKAIHNFSRDRISPASCSSETDFLILTPDFYLPLPYCKILLIPDESTEIPVTETAVSYGMSSKCSVTLSSVGKRSVLAIQREIITLKGKIIEPQEIPIKNMYNLSKYALMASSAALLILGVTPKSLS